MVLCFIQTMVSTAAIDHLDFLQAESDVNRYLCYFLLTISSVETEGKKKNHAIYHVIVLRVIQ